MRQTTLSVALEVKPGSETRLNSVLDALRTRASVAPNDGPGPYADFTARVPALHFLSLSVFPGFDHDPLFVIEANFDGAPGIFWAQLEDVIGAELRAILRCCKQPLDADGPLYDAVTGAPASAPIALYLAARTLRPTVFHHGNRGLSRDRILAERALFLATRAELARAPAGADPDRGRDPATIHAALRAALLPHFPWLDAAAPPRIPIGENLADWARLIGFVLALVAALSLPGLALKPWLPWPWFAALAGGALLACIAALYRIGKPLPGTATPSRFSFLRFFFTRLLLPIGLALIGYVLVASLIGGLAHRLWFGHGFGPAFRRVAGWAAWSAASIAAVVAILLVWLRWLERRDSAQDSPSVDPQMLQAMAQREDWIPQNHMGSVVLIKPGILRAILIPVGHHGLHLVLRAMRASRAGYLGAMRTIHFAHWARVNNGSRLMFFSNFDQTWESYLDDFIEKAHAGLTLAWSSGIGFPATRFLVKDGASHGRKFKEWARHSMAVSRFWYSAYRDLTADQIERNNRIAGGLRRPRLGATEAASWAIDL